MKAPTIDRWRHGNMPKRVDHEERRAQIAEALIQVAGRRGLHAVVAVLAASADVRGAIGFSSLGVLAHYAIANASAWTLAPDEGRPARISRSSGWSAASSSPSPSRPPR